MMQKPFLIVVTGRPGSGKTTLAHRLASTVHCPALCRDEFKEGYVHTWEGSHESLGPDVNRRVFDIFFDTVRTVVSHQVSVVIEAAFQHHVWEPQLSALTDRARVAVVICTVDPALARSRFIQRSLQDAGRERFHGDFAVHAAKSGVELLLSEYQPPQMDLPTLMVNTTNGYEPTLSEIASFAVPDFPASSGNL